jgi:alkanesulfonate monooxygenase SsuD/methylene tetrahydromethanopterin reductase-like flavin-dependent oxidoreductase (luciferase family)
MEISVGLPVMDGVSDDVIREWGRHAEAAGFSALALTNRIPVDDEVRLSALRIAAAETTTLGLLTATVLRTAREDPAAWARSIGELQLSSQGRVRVAIVLAEIGEDDFRISGVDSFENRAIFELFIEAAQQEWAAAGTPAPSFYFSGLSDATTQRVGRWGTGWFSPAADGPARFKRNAGLLDGDWEDAERTGRPRLVGVLRTALGGEAADLVAAYDERYAAGHGGLTRGNGTPATTPEAVAEAVDAFAAQGADEVVIEPASTDVAQLDALVAALGARLAPVGAARPA